MNTNKNVTRRSFVKRQGGITLGSVIGLGLLPSVSRKLYASDTSNNQFLTGIQFVVPWQDPPSQGVVNGFGWLGTRNEDTAYQSQRQSTQNYTDAMGHSGTVTITTYTSANALPAPNHCVASLRMETITKIDYDMIVAVGGIQAHYFGTMNRHEIRYYECLSGTVTKYSETIDQDDDGGTSPVNLVYGGGSRIPPIQYPNGGSNQSWIEVASDGSGVRLRNTLDSPAAGTAFTPLTRDYGLSCCVL